MTKCSFDPESDKYKEFPIGHFTCPECGTMLLAGLPHPKPKEKNKENGSK